MAGSKKTPGAADSEPTEPVKPKLTTFTCGNCGASVAIRYPGHSLSVVCDSCQSVIDSSNPQFVIIQKYHKATKHYVPRIELGSRGELFGKTWEVIGFLIRTDKASAFCWEEYLLFNPYYGYRWLTYNNYHWSFVTSIKEKPSQIASRQPSYRHNYDVYLNKKHYKVFYKGRAFVSFVLGEFYWKVAVGEDVEMEDYICPPQMLSCEIDNTQQIWSVSEYLDSEVVPRAFALTEELPAPIGVAPNQPSIYKEVWDKISFTFVFFFFVLTFFQFQQLNTANNEEVLSASYPYTTNSKSAQTITTPVFNLDREKGNLAIDIQTNVDNAWFYIYGELCANDDDQTYPFDRTIEYYHGYTSGEYWTEGSTSTHLHIPSVPGGKYYLNFDTEHGDYPATTLSSPKEFHISVRRNVPTYANYFLCLFMLSIIPVFIWWTKQKFEITRWSESDFSPWAMATYD